MNSTSKILITAIGAAAAGAVIGLLLAPEKGSDLRQKIQSAANDWADQLIDLVNSSREKLGEVKGELKARAENGLAEVREKM
ncbi:MAG TPA: YtxH domain-containing protein [Chitinophagaceae bacterium]|nr:YtxH domain-containing protein [Chitinophagaceae bacterium]